jgi:hypothetical protein
LIADSISVSVFAVTTKLIISPTNIDLGLVPSCALVIAVNVSPLTAVTLKISEFNKVGKIPVGYTTTLNGGLGNKAPPPLARVKDVPDRAGLGAPNTEVLTRFL